MVAPTAFGFNEQAAQDNSFMHAAAKPGEGTELTRAVLKEFAGLHHALTEQAGVKVGQLGGCWVRQVGESNPCCKAKKQMIIGFRRAVASSAMRMIGMRRCIECKRA